MELLLLKNDIKMCQQPLENVDVDFQRVGTSFVCHRTVTVWHSGQPVVFTQPAQRPGPVRQLTSPTPVDTVCFNCKQPVVTYVEYESGSCTYVSCVGLALVG